MSLSGQRTATFKGFFIQARMSDLSDAIIGSFDVVKSDQFRFIDCPGGVNVNTSSLIHSKWLNWEFDDEWYCCLTRMPQHTFSISPNGLWASCGVHRPTLKGDSTLCKFLNQLTCTHFQKKYSSDNYLSFFSATVVQEYKTIWIGLETPSFKLVSNPVTDLLRIKQPFPNQLFTD